MARKLDVWTPPELYKDLMPAVSGNTVNGLGEREVRRPSPFFWHPANLIPHHAPLQAQSLGLMFGSSDAAEVIEAFHLSDPMNNIYQGRGPDPIETAPRKAEATSEVWTERVKAFALAHQADVVGIARMRPEWVYDGFEIKEQWVIVVGVAHDYEQMTHGPCFPGENRLLIEVGRQYTRAASAAAHLSNYIREFGHDTTCHPGPSANALLIIPAAIDAGLGELGKHGSLINRTLGASFRLSAVTTDLPLVADQPDVFGADDFCMNCQVCTDICPPAAIVYHKQWVRGVERWYVDFDKCIPYFSETRSCGLCIVACPWSRPGVAHNLVAKMAARRARVAT
jgi:epoxyqueuosine reductase